jgi:hypothetical protein
VLKELAALEPNRAEVRIELAWSQYFAGQLNDASTTLAGITVETAEQAPRYFAALANVQLGLGDRTAASRTLDLLERYGKTEADRTQAENLRRRLR